MSSKSDRAEVALAARQTVLTQRNGLADPSRFALVHFDEDGSIWANRGLGEDWVSITDLLSASDAPDEAMEQAIRKLYPECSDATRDTLVSLSHMAGAFLGAGGGGGNAELVDELDVVRDAGDDEVTREFD